MEWVKIPRPRVMEVMEPQVKSRSSSDPAAWFLGKDFLQGNFFEPPLLQRFEGLGILIDAAPTRLLTATASTAYVFCKEASETQ